MKTVTSNLLLSTAILFNTQLAAASSSCPSIVTSSTDCSAAIFDGSGSIDATCTDDTLTVSGSVTLSSGFDEDAIVTAVPCVAGGVCWPKYTQKIGKFCRIATNADGYDCGTAGTYTLSEDTYEIPDGNVRAMYGTVTFKLLLDDDADCEEGQSYFSRMLGFAAVPLVGVGVFSYLRQRKRRRPVLVLEGVNDGLVEMQKHGAMV
jgi:hypothetical protein